MSIARVFALVALLVASVAAHANPDPTLGRFLQRDPRGSGQIVQDNVMWFHGRPPMVSQPVVNVQSMYGDGMNLYEYLGSNPIVRSDPMGLSWDPFDMMDEIANEHQLSGLLVLAKVDSFFRDKDVLRKIRAYERGGFEWADMVWDRDVGILFSMVAGPFFAKICFVEGTVIATPTGPEPIECLSLGREVTSQKDPEHVAAGVELPPGTDAISLVRMRYRHSDGSTTTMEMLRPTKLIASLALAAGCHLPVAIPEMGFAGSAEVLAVEPYCNAIRLDVPVVTGRFVTDSAEVVNVYLEGYEHPIGVTPKHPVFSADRDTWVPSGELQQGERLKSTNGIAVVARVEPSPMRTTVYNVEVSHYHTYFVGDAGVWAHNPCQLSDEAQQLVRQFKSSGQLEQRSLAAFKMGGEMRVGSSHYDIINSFRNTNFSGWSHGYVRWVNGEWVFRLNY